MNKIWLLLLVLIIPFISAICEEGQIDINTASAVELDKIKWVGEPTAQKIIAARPFNSLDDLIKVSGLGGTGSRVNDIKTQGLACVAEEKSENSQEKIVEEVKEQTPIEGTQTAVEPVKETKIENPETIVLNAKTIKTVEDKRLLDKAIYGLIPFWILLFVLFTFKKYTRKNEFR